MKSIILTKKIRKEPHFRSSLIDDSGSDDISYHPDLLRYYFTLLYSTSSA